MMLMAKGSSPRLRGTQTRPNPGLQRRGIIPALAGNTWGTRSPTVQRWDHPRACGEHSKFLLPSPLNVGSSPRLRGTLPLRPSRIAFHGIIPALAGNTSWSIRRPSPQRDHPRACGEHENQRCGCMTLVGSSPRLRGTQCFINSANGYWWIIPALAGNTYRFCSWRCFLRDHPRACGEHRSGIEAKRRERGSSPRLRGTHEPAGREFQSGGIIPALAGNTASTRSATRSTRDHPRACGEHIPGKGHFFVEPGSSPRLRGTPHRFHNHRTMLGIIPALAGNTVSFMGFGSLSRDHPRACGEHAMKSQ